ncbi:MAG: class I SAM-dependent methyltransferase [Phycisphaerales bacterium JB039]
MDRYELYELTVQSPRHAAALLRAIHGRRPEILGEDFAGTAALSRYWAASAPGARAVAVDLDGEALGRAAGAEGVTLVQGDVREATEPVDVLFVGNFSIGYLHGRAELVGYLRHALGRLRAEGVFVCDTYGGESAFVVGHVHRYHRTADGRRIRYTWEQREADPLTGMVTDVLHFRVDRAGEIEGELRDAFVYRWRLWSVPELRDAMVEAGFAGTAVYAQLPDAEDDQQNAYAQPLRAEELGESFIVCVAGRR